MQVGRPVKVSLRSKERVSVLHGALLAFALAWAIPGTARAQDDPPEQGMPAGSQMLRGAVTASSPDAITIKTETGETYKVTVSPNTRLTKARQPIKLADIKPGDGVGAMGVMDVPAKTLHALFIGVIDAEQIKKAQADLGKTYIIGHITSIDELKLTIKRADGVSQTIEVDEGTSFRKGGRGMGMMMGGGGSGEGAPPAGQAQRTPRQGETSGGESITLADIKVGDSVAGRGALKNGIFVPTELRVADPAARARRRKDGEASPAPGNPAPAPPSGAPQ